MKNKILARSFITLTPALIALIAAIIANSVMGLDFSAFTRDPASIGDIHPLAGMLSSLGNLLWGASFFISLFTALTLRLSIDKKDFLFLITSALLSGYLLFDDFFMFHDFLAPGYLGIKEQGIFLFLITGGITYLYFNRNAILKTNYWMLMIAMALLALSVFMDAVYLPFTAGRFGHWKNLLEDGPKWLGIACWCSYHVLTSHQYIKERLGLEKGEPGNN